jgi:hypothetical protein
VTAAARAPSGDNTQPWTFSWDGRVLTVLFDPGKAHHVLDAGFSAAKISLGCVLESAFIAASAYGLSAQYRFIGLSQEAGQPAAEVTFFANNRKPDALIDAIPKRTTDRRPFHKGALPVEDLNAVSQAFEERDVVRADFVDSIPADLFDYLVAAESLVARHPSIFPDTLPWIRLSDRETARTQDGMPWRGTGVNILQYPVLPLLRTFPRLFPVISRSGMQHVQRATIKRLLNSSAGLFCVSTAQPGTQALLSAGRLAMRLWLRLTQLGYGVQPLTISSLSVYNAKIGVLDPASVQLFGSRYAEGERIMRRAFGIPENHVPAWMLRTGLSSPLPSSWWTPRKGLETILRITC